MSSTKRKRADSARDRHPRKRTRDLPCPSWLMSTGSNTHVAKDRSWFCDDYRPISSFICHPLGRPVPVIGTGTVVLPVKVSPNADDRTHDTVRLRNVLHAPEATCNVIGMPVCDDYDVQIGGFRDPTHAGRIALLNGIAVGFFTLVESRLQLRLSGTPIGPHVGPSPFRPGIKYWIRAEWPLEEPEKWLATPRSQSQATAQPTQTAGPDRPSAEEREWLKTHYGNEYKFLIVQGLKIYKDEDRRKGLDSVRAMMAEDERRSADMSSQCNDHPMSSPPVRRLNARAGGNSATQDSALDGNTRPQ